MKINAVISPSFKRQLTDSEKSEYLRVLKEGKEKVGNTGISMLIMPSIALPQAVSNNTGVGNLLNNESMEFFDFVHEYMGINNIQILSDGEYSYSTEPNGKMSFRPYSGSSFGLGNQHINMQHLTTKENGSLLTQDDIKNLINSNSASNKESNVYFENVIPADSKTEDLLKKACDNLIKADTPEKKEMLKNIETYSLENKSWLEPKSLHYALTKHYNTGYSKDWKDIDRNLYNTDLVSLKQREKRINQIKKEQAKEVKYIEFKQYLADSHLQKAREELHKRGMKLSGDMLIGYRFDERWANPKAFLPDKFVGWGINVQDFDKEEGLNLLREKAKLFAKRYDSVRIDAAWIYSLQPHYKYTHKDPDIRKDYKDKLLKIIEEEFQKVKGTDYNKESLSWEFIFDAKDYSLDRPEINNRLKLQLSAWLNESVGTTESAYNKKWGKDEYILGTTNHDNRPMKWDFEKNPQVKEQIDLLSKILKIPKEKIGDAKSYIQAKFAETMRAKNSMHFFTEVFALDGFYQGNISKADDYRIKLAPNYKDEYFKKLEKGEGFNPMDALEKAFIADGLDKTHSELCKKIVKFNKIFQGREHEKDEFINETKKVNKKKSGKKFITVGIIGIAAIAATAFIMLSKNKKAENNPAYDDE